MLKGILGVLIVLLITISAFGQSSTENEPPAVESQVWKINFLLPGLEYERKLGNSTTLNANAYLRFGYSSNFIFGDAWLVQPSLDVQFREYYNLYKRLAKGKRISGNSANFFALGVFGVGRSIVDRQDFRNYSYFGIGPLWGLQRTFPRKFNYSFSVGPSVINSGSDDIEFLLRLNLRLGLGFIPKK